jgi:hypothetical protein
MGGALSLGVMLPTNLAGFTARHPSGAVGTLWTQLLR